MKRGFTRRQEAELNDYIKDWLDKNLKHVLQPSYLGWVTRIGGGPRPTAPMTVQVRPQGESKTDAHDLVVLDPTTVPQIGDLVDCYRRDGQTGYVMAVLSSSRGIGPVVTSRITVGIDIAAPAAQVNIPIPPGFSVAQLDYVLRSDNAVNNNDVYLRCNGDAGPNYDGERTVNGAPTAFTGQTQMIMGYSPGTLATTGNFARGRITLVQYGVTNMDKEVHCQATLSLGGSFYVLAASGMWRTQGQPVSSLNILTGGPSNIVAASHFVLTVY